MAMDGQQKPKSNQKLTLAQIKELTEYMRSIGAHSFEALGVKVEFGLSPTASTPVTIDDEQERTKALKEQLKQALKEQDEDLFWSAQ